MEDPRAPLMAGNEDRADERESSDAGDNLPPRGSRKPADTNPGAFVVALTLAAGISGLLFGCKRHGCHLGDSRLHRHRALEPVPHVHGQVRHHVVDVSLCPRRVAAVFDSRRQVRP
ncbi:hypothetical protein OCS_05606 [Ophiocordyceps sinensis CO18]|uniref:Uncharacterized protein n=1 Tax=Ophiocordyceps sinensis (strain Co18 / CGMCC 3.14243) TaxID=911162 RepID=T4ZZX7_OPHSC|nr:hypothetical protein OCS_05606 [Ophiocordyceps sinensis CO18]